MDYRSLLKKYMNHVDDEKGVTFVKTIWFDGSTDSGKIRFTEEEVDELKKIEAEPLTAPDPLCITIHRCYLSRFDVAVSRIPVTLSPEWYARNNKPQGSEDTTISDGRDTVSIHLLAPLDTSLITLLTDLGLKDGVMPPLTVTFASSDK